MIDGPDPEFRPMPRRRLSPVLVATLLPLAEYPGGPVITGESISFSQVYGQLTMHRSITRGDGQHYTVDERVRFNTASGALTQVPFTCPPNADCAVWVWSGEISGTTLTITYQEPPWPAKRYLSAGPVAERRIP